MSNRSSRGAPRAQRGVVLFVSLMVLVVLLIGGIALMRGVGSSVILAGNLGMKRTATAAADLGMEAAKQWLTANRAALGADRTADGYYATWVDAFDAAAYDWGQAIGPVGAGRDTTCRSLLDAAPGGVCDPLGNDVRYVVHRLCRNPGAVTALECVLARGAGAASSQSGANNATGPLSGGQAALYRVTIRVTGPKGTTSITQAVVSI